MADDVTVDNGGLTDYIVATDEDSGDSSHYQLIKLAYGALGTFTLVETGVGLPVSVQGSVAISGSVTVDSELPAAAALTDNFANPTAPAVGAFAMGWDGAAWDRLSAPGGILRVLDTDTLNQSDDSVSLGDGTNLIAIQTAGADNETNNENSLRTAARLYGYDGATWDRLLSDAGALRVADGGGLRVHGVTAHDGSLAAFNPLAAGGRASTAIPTPVSADGDSVWAWHDRQGAAKTVMVDDAGDSAMDGANNALRVNIVAGGGSGGTSSTDESTYTPTTSLGTPVMGGVDETSPDAAAEGTLAIIRSTLNRALHVNLRDASGAELAVGGGTQYDEDTAHVSGDKLTMAGVVQQTADTALAADGDRTAMQVDESGFLKVAVMAGGGGGVQYTEGDIDATITGTVVMWEDISNTVVAASAAKPFPVDVGNTVAISDAGNSISVDDNGGSLTVDGTVAISGTVTVDTELPAAAALSDNFANPTAPGVGAFGMVWDGTNWDRLSGDDLSVFVQGTDQHDGGVQGRPVLIGGYASAAAPSSVTLDADMVRAWFLRNGAQATVITAAGALIGGDATNGLDVDVTRVTGTVTVGATDLDIRNLDVAQDDVRVGGMAALDAAVADNPVAIGGRASDAVPTAVSADGDAVWAWLDRRGAAKTVVVDDAGDSAMDGTNNALRVNVVAGSGAGVSHVDSAAFTVTTDDVVPIAGYRDDTSPDALAETEAGAIRATEFRALHVNLRDATGAELSVGGGTQYDEDTAHTAAEKITMAGVVRKDTAASLVDTDSDRTELIVDSTGRLHVNVGNTITIAEPVTVDGTVIVTATDLDIRNLVQATDAVSIGDGTDLVDVETAGADALGNTLNELITGAFNYVFNGTSWDRARGDTTNGLDVDVTRLPALVAGSANIGDVDIASVAAGTVIEVIGDVAHDAAAPANPVVVGAQMETMADSAPGTRSGTDGDATKLATADGAQYVITTGPQTFSYHDDDAAAVTTDGTVHAAPGSGLSLYITDIIFSIGAATASSIFIEESTTKVLGPYYLEAIAGRGLAIHFVTPKKITANTAALVTNTGSILFSVDILGFIAPG